MMKGNPMNGLVANSGFSAGEILAQLERLCSSSVFARASAVQQLLRYLVTEAAAGRGDMLSREHLYTKFGKKQLRLRDEESLSTYKKRIQQRLDVYYASASSADLIRISMRSDSFRPDFSLHGSIRPVVGRDADLGRFRRFYGHRKDELSVVSVGGVSGIGKTTLAKMLLQDAMALAEVEHVISVHGPSDSRSGSPYLPFRDCVVGILNEVGKTAIALRDELAPSWRNPSTQGIASELGAFLQELTKRRRIAVFLDNFHLSDYSSEGLLSELARTWFRSRLLIIVAFREFEPGSVGHPYLGAERRLELEEKCLRLRPQTVTMPDVREYLMKRFPQNLFPPDLTRVVNDYSRGIPLHLVNLIDHLERSEIVLSNSRWTITHSPDQIAAELVSLARHFMALPLVALGEEQRYMLSVAALLGERFDSALLAGVVQKDRGAVERDLDIIYRTQRLIELAELSVNENPYGASVRYRFSHSSYRDAFLAIFDTLPTERANLANRAIDLLSVDAPVGSPTHSARIAGLLEAAGRIPEAVNRYAESSQLSSSTFAHGTAALLARRAIHLLTSLGEDSPVRASRMHLNILLGLAVMSTSGFAAPELESIYSSVVQDSLALGNAEGERIGLYGLWVHSVDSGRIELSLDYANQVLTKAIAAEDVATEVEAHYANGTSLIQLGRLAEAKTHFLLSLPKADALGLRSHWFYQLDAAVSVRCQLARALWFLGESKGALEMVEQALSIAEEKSHPESRAYALVFLADISHLRRETERALEWSEQAISASVDCGASQELAWAKMIHGWSLGQKHGEEDAAVVELGHSFAFYKQLNARVALTKFHCLAAEVYLRQGNPEESMRQLDHGQEEVAETKEVYFESELHRVRAEALLALGGEADVHAAAESFRRSYRIAAQLNARPLQLRTALGIYVHRQQLGVSEEESRSLLAQTCSQIPALNGDPEVRTVRTIIESRPTSSA
jgi:tetratricopeptide (TPR) repeat protein